MKNLYKPLFIAIMAFSLASPYFAVAGNKDRSGQAGASELLINPWARSTGWAGVNIANTYGLESMYTNVAGLAFTQRTEVIFSNTQWLRGSEINISNFGLAQRLGPGSVLGISVMSVGFGDIPIRTVELPEGGIGTFSPSYMNFNIAYAKAFSNTIYGGFNFKIINESISDVSAIGVAIDAGIQYVTGEQENVRFGIALKNWGPTMRFKGDGLSIRSLLPGQDDYFTLEHRSADFELPSQLSIGGSYGFILSEEHKLTTALAFVSNSFYKDQYVGGLEYNFKNIFMVRGGYAYEDGIFSTTDRTNAHTGWSAGATIQAPLSKDKGSSFSVDYSYRDSDPFSGTHTIAARLNF